MRITATAVFEHPTPRALADHLAPAPTGTLASLYRKVCEAGRPGDAMRMVVAASWALPAFDDVRPQEPRRLSDGDGPAVVCFPSFPSPPGEYAALARSLPGTWVLPHPGHDGGPVPDSLDTLVRSHVEALRRFDRPYVLLGRSTGGLVAQAVAREVRPAALVLVDTHPVTDDDWLQELAARGALRLDETRLAAMGAYARLFLDWTAEPSVPTLHLRPGDVPGDHYTVLEEHSATTAEAISAWLAGRSHEEEESV